MIGSVIVWLLNYFLKQHVFSNGTVFGMRNQLQQHFVITFGTEQRVFSEAVEEPLLKRLGRQYSVSVGIFRHIWRYDVSQLFSRFFIPYVSVQSVISDSMKSLWQNMLYHASNKAQDRECFVFNLPGFVVPIPVTDRLAVIAFNPANRDGRRDNIFCQILSQPFPAGGYFSGLKESDKSFGVLFPGLVDVFFRGRIGHFFSEHRQKMILPLFVHHLIGNIRNRLPLAARVNSSCGHQDMQVGVVMAGASGGLQHDDVSDVQIDAGAGFENVFEAGMSGPHEGAEPVGVAKEPEPKTFRHGQYDMAIGDPGQQASADEVGPSIGVSLGTGQTEAGFAGESDTSYFAAVAASVLDKTHLVRVAAVEHFLNGIVIIGTVKSRLSLLKRIPVIIENLLECVFVNAIHGCSLRTTITEMTK